VLAVRRHRWPKYIPDVTLTTLDRWKAREKTVDTVALAIYLKTTLCYRSLMMLGVIKP
jgi:hypothetical protein